MISIGFDERVQIGLQYVLESLHACCPFGAERVQKLRFYAPEERDALETELKNVERAKNAANACAALYESISASLCQLKDVRGSLRRLSEGETLDHVELFEIKGFLLRVAELIPQFERMNETVRAEGIAFFDPEAALDVLDPERTRSRGFYIPDGATDALKRIRAEKKRLEQRLYEAKTDAERDEIRLLRTRVCADEEAEERAVRRTMCERLLPYANELFADADAAGRLDFLIRKALFAVRYGAVRPKITDGALALVDMTNPELCDLLKEKGRAFVPVSIETDRGATVITGANMGGKSVAMKTVALNVLLMHAGFLVCAKTAKLPMFSCVKMLFDDAQSMQSGLSGFGSEIVRFNEALEEVEQGYSLFLLDEFARGTNPDEGAVIVQAVTRYLNGINAVSILATHYDGVAAFARAHYQIIGLRDVDPESIRSELAAKTADGPAVIARHMNYGLYRVEGKADCPKDALHILRMLSMKPEILECIETAY
jgi:dsDNA-specific endonuclease/ATPase MutS2